jgi:hypothetical protein
MGFMEITMKTAARTIAVALVAAVAATAAIAPAASAREWQDQHRTWHQEPARGHDDTAALIGLGIAAFAGAALIASATQQPAYAPPPAYYRQPAYAAPSPTCTTINGYAACIGPDGTWQYVR